MHSLHDPKRVLVVDDEVLILRVVAALLDGLAVVRTAATAADALTLLATEPFDVMLCDHHLGAEVTGSELLDDVAVRWPAVRRYLISASDIPTVHAVLRKPFDFDTLRGVVEG